MLGEREVQGGLLWRLISVGSVHCEGGSGRTPYAECWGRERSKGAFFGDSSASGLSIVGEAGIEGDLKRGTLRGLEAEQGPNGPSSGPTWPYPCLPSNGPLADPPGRIPGEEGAETPA